MLNKAKTKVKRFYDENQAYCGYVGGVVLTTVAFIGVCLFVDYTNEQNGFKTIRLYKDSETGDILAQDTSGKMWKADFPEIS